MQNTTILNYRLIRKIGEGGFAEVWLGEHIKLGTKVAIKLLDKKIVELDGFKDRFLRAAKLLSSLKHPHIVEVIDYDDSDKYAMIMEYLEGPMFRDYINQHYITTNPLQFIPLFIQVLDAVGYVHKKGVIHRDIKPTNVIVLHSEDKIPETKLLDFDIAKDVNSEHTATLTNQQMGTITYMSPEQIISSKDIDLRSDIYSLGVMLFYVVSGKAAYSAQADSQFTLMEKIVKQPLSDLKSINPNIPDWVVDVLRKSTEKDPGKRFQSCQEFKKAILDHIDAKHDDEKTQIVQNINSEETQVFVDTNKKIKRDSVIDRGKEEVIITQKKKAPALLIALVVFALVSIGAYFYVKYDTQKTTDSSTLSDSISAGSLTHLNNTIVRDSTYIAADEPNNKKSIDESEINTLFKKAKEAQENKKIDEAIRLYNEALDLGDIRAYNNLGFIYAYDKKAFDKAIEYYKKGVEANDYNAMGNLGLLYFQMKDIRNAETYLGKAYQINKERTLKLITELRKQKPDFLKNLK